MRTIISCFIVPAVLSFPASNFLSPGRTENYLAAGFWRATAPKDTVASVQKEGDLGVGFWPSAKYLMLRRRKLVNATASPKKSSDSWDVYGESTGAAEDQTTTVAGTTVVPVTVAPLPATPTLSESELRAKLLGGTPPRFLKGATDDAKVSFAKIGMGGNMTKAQLKQAYTDWAEKQETKTKEAFYRQREEHDLKVKLMRKKIMEKSLNRLSPEAKVLFDQIQTIHDNYDLTLDENIGMVKEVINQADESVQEELHKMRKRFAMLF